MTSPFFPMIISNLLAGITGFIGIFNLFTLREALMILIMVSPVSVWSWRVIDIAAMILLGIIWLIVVILSQARYDKAYKQKHLSKDFSLVTGYQFLLFFIASIVVHLFDFQTAAFQEIILTVLKALLATCLLFYAYKSSQMKHFNAKL